MFEAAEFPGLSCVYFVNFAGPNLFGMGYRWGV